MKPEVLALFECPKCRSGPLAVNQPASGSRSDELTDDALCCARCGGHFPIRTGVPRFVPADNYAASFGMQWNRHRRTQLDSHTGLPITRDRLRATTRWPDDLRGQRVLEAGSGAGRFTEVLVATGAEIYSFDYSSAVDANLQNNCHAPNLHLFQADIFNIPLCKQAFDKVLCLGVLQHTPDPEAAFGSLASHVAPGGELVVDLYAKRLTALVSWKYLLRPITRRMDKQMLHALVERGVDLLLPLAARLRRLAGRAAVRLLPIAEYSNLGLSPELNRQWAILDTFDMYSPAHDHPQTARTLRRWCEDAGLVDVEVEPGANGIVGRGRRPVSA